MGKRIRKKASVDTFATVKNFIGCKMQLLLAPVITFVATEFLQGVTNNAGSHLILSLRHTLGVEDAAEVGTTTTEEETGCHGTTMAMAMVTKTTCQSKTVINHVYIITMSHDKL